MNIIYLTSIVVLVILLYYCYKSDSLNKEQIKSETTKEIDSEIINDINTEIANQIIPEAAKEIKPEIVTKNKWLYPTDEFGKMERGVVHDSITYVYELNENNKNDLVILSEKKREKRPKDKR